MLSERDRISQLGLRTRQRRLLGPIHFVRLRSEIRQQLDRSNGGVAPTVTSNDLGLLFTLTHLNNGVRQSSADRGRSLADDCSFSSF